MADTAPRVVVLGRAGEAQQQLLNALNELGAQTLAVGDFDQLEPDEIRAKQPDVWLVSIDEGTDSGRMDRWQPLFDDPDATVIFDDADVTRRLSGWDLARWARHLAAKVLGRDDVLPPVSPDAERLPQPGPDGEAQETPVPVDLVMPFEAASPPADSQPAKGFADLKISDEDAAFAALNASFAATREQQARAEKPAMALDDLLMAQAQADSGSSKPAGPPPASGGAASAAAPPSKSELSLLGMDVDLSTPRVVEAPVVPEPAFDLSHLELEPLAEPEEDKGTAAAAITTGAVLIIAGLGGPDAVRQFLGGLPGGITMPVLLWQHLDAGKHDRLAQQMAKATKLPVYLAKPGDLARSGEVGVMGVGMGVISEDGSWWVKQGSPSPSHALAPALKDARSILVVLSGAEPVIVEFAKSHRSNGGLVLVQTSATCFDGTATAALESQGIASGSPGNLAQRAAEKVAAG